jgi:hypothetical protein
MAIENQTKEILMKVILSLILLLGSSMAFANDSEGVKCINKLVKVRGEIITNQEILRAEIGYNLPLVTVGRSELITKYLNTAEALSDLDSAAVNYMAYGALEPLKEALGGTCQ